MSNEGRRIRMLVASLPSGGGGGSTAWADITGKPAAVTALSGTNTGDQDLAGYATTAAVAAGYQPLATVLTNTTASFTTTKDTKLTGIATGATANDTDANLKSRANHTGTQLAATISDFSTTVLANATAVTGLLGARTVAAFKTGLSLVKGDVGLGSVDNTADSAKNVATAATLTTARAIAMTGDVAWSVNFNGGAAVSAAGTLATVNLNTGTFGGAATVPQISVNGKGLVTAVTAVGIAAPWAGITGIPAAVSGLTGTNTGDQTSIVGITGTLAQFNTAISDADILSTTAAAAAYQPLDSDLSAIAALTTTGFGQGFLTLADAAAGRTKLGLGSIATTNTADYLSVTGGSLSGPLAVGGLLSGRGVKGNLDSAAGTVNLNPRVTVYDDGTSLYGMDLGWAGDNFVTRVFAPNGSNGVVIAGTVYSATLQSDMTEWLRINGSGLTVAVGKVKLPSFTNSSPVDGDIWFDGTVFKKRQGGTTTDLDTAPNATYRTILDSSGSHTAARVAGTYGMGQGDALAISGTGTLYPLNLIYLDSADFPTIGGLATKLRLRCVLSVNDVAPTGNYTVGLHPVTRPATSGGAGLNIFTVGAAVAGSTVTVSAPAADSLNNLVGSDFAMPANGVYVIGVVTTATVATSSHVHLSAQLQQRNA